MDTESVWVFSGYGPDPHLPSGVFKNRENAEVWIARHQLSGLLTRYPLDVGVYDWAIQMNLFHPRTPQHSGPRFIQTFNLAALEHYHYRDGHWEGLEIVPEPSPDQ